MRDVALGDIMSLDIERVAVDPLQSYSLAGVYSFGRGLFARDRLLGSKTSYKYFHLLRPGRFVMSKLKAWEGAVGVVSSDFDGFVLSPEFPTYRLNPALVIPAFLAMVTTWSAFWELLALESRGIGGRRERVHQDRLLDITIGLPTLDDQRRMVNLVASVNSAGHAARVLAANCEGAYRAKLDDLEAAVELRMSLASAVVAARAGGTPSRKVPTHFGGGIPWLKSGEVTNDRILSTEETISETGLSESSAWVVPAESIVVAMYGATAGAVGYLGAPMATNQAVLAIGVDPTRFSQRFMFHWLRGRSEAMKARATGAAQPNLSKERVLEEKVPVLALEKQQEAAALLDAMLDIAREADRVAGAAEEVRSSILADLLTGEHQIPDSYDDALLELE